MTVKDVGDLIIWVAAVIVALGAILRYVVVKPLRHSLTDELSPVVSRLEKVEQGQAGLDQRMSDHIMTHRKDLGCPNR